jgi:hypothetical protein
MQVGVFFQHKDTKTPGNQFRDPSGLYAFVLKKSASLFCGLQTQCDRRWDYKSLCIDRFP